MLWKRRLREPLTRLLVTALTISALAVVTRQLRVFVENEAMAVFESVDETEEVQPRLRLEVEGASPVSNAVAPVKRARPSSALSSQRLWICTPAGPKALPPGPSLEI